MKAPKISIIVPVYNVEPYIRKCLDSILSQTYYNWEAILVDDGSTDQSGAICDEYAKKDARFVVVHKQNEGVAKARITAFEHSKGELITFIDSDDYVSPEYLEKLSKPILEKDVDMVSCDYCMVDETGKIQEPRAKLAGFFQGANLNDFITNPFFYDEDIRDYGMTCFLWTKMVKREYVLQGLKQGIDLWYGEDQISIFAMLLKCHSLVLIPDRLYYYVQHEGQTMWRYDFSLWEDMIVMFSRYEQLLENKKLGTAGFRIKTWLNISRTISLKMIPAHLDSSTFINHLSKMRSHPFMEGFFTPWFIKHSWKSNIEYWMLKMRCYRFLLWSIKLRQSL